MNPMPKPITRRDALSKAGLMAGTALAASASMKSSASAAEMPHAPGSGFVLCLNTATLRGFKMALVDEIDLAAKSGYRAIEPWIDKVHQYATGGGSLKDLGKRISDAGLTVESAIGFAQFIVDDEAARAKGLEQARLDMDAVAQIGGKRLAGASGGRHQRTGSGPAQSGGTLPRPFGTRRSDGSSPGTGNLGSLAEPPAFERGRLCGA